MLGQQLSAQMSNHRNSRQSSVFSRQQNLVFLRTDN
jgi:hypothetical protein